MKNIGDEEKMLDEAYSHGKGLFAKKLDALITKLCEMRPNLTEVKSPMMQHELLDVIILAEELKREPRYYNNIFH